MNPLLAAIACHRAAQACVRAGWLDKAGDMFLQRDKFLRDARALRRIQNVK